MMCDNSYIKCPGGTNPRRQKGDSWLPEAEPQVTGDRFRVLLRVRKMSYNKIVEAGPSGARL